MDGSFLNCWYVGSEEVVRRFISDLEERPDVQMEEMKEMLGDLRGHFAFIVHQGSRIIAAVDKIRSYPVFYCREGGRLQVSNSARALMQANRLDEVDGLSLLEFRMAGYVTGRNTLLKFLWQVQAGEFISWDVKRKALERERYYLFRADSLREETEDDLIGELDEITNHIFEDVIRKSDGRPIWVPLSGGLDSRLILCKLKQLGYDRLRAFSYGPERNDEAKVAREVAERVGVPWHFVPSSMRSARRFFYSELRRNYWTFADGMNVVPNMQDFPTLCSLKESRQIPSDGIVINGQSGDFITGGHIPEPLIRGPASLQMLVDRIQEKHYSQWLHLKSTENLDIIGNKIRETLAITENRLFSPQEMSICFEQWEWQERQCKYVINGQRAYDFLGLDWFLPLWYDEYLEFWEKIPLGLKYYQNLYRRYLDRYDFFHCFKNLKPVIWRWPGVSKTVIPFGKAIKATLGEKCSSAFYGYFKYFGHYRDFYAPYGIKCYLKNAQKIRGPISLQIDTWKRENVDERLS